MLNVAAEFRIARAIGRGDYSAAIAEYEVLHAKNSDDLTTMPMLAHCHLWNDDPAKAIVVVQSIEKYEQLDFDMLNLLTQCYSELEDHESGYKYACSSLANPPDPTIDLPWPINMFARLRNAVNKDAQTSWRNLMWTQKYKKWCEDELGY